MPFRSKFDHSGVQPREEGNGMADPLRIVEAEWMGEKSFGLLNHLSKQITIIDERTVKMAVCQENLRNEIGNVKQTVHYGMWLLGVIGTGIIGAIGWFAAKLPWDAILKAAMK